MENEKENELPNGWVSDFLENMIRPRGEKALPSDYPQLKFVGMDHVESKTTKIIGYVAASEMKSSAARFYTGDVLYGRLRPYLNKVALVNFDGLASAEFIVFPDSNVLSNSYLKHRLNAADFVRFAAHINEGDRPRVSFEQIGKFVILLPPLAEQQRIVAKIEELFSELDKGVENLRAAQEQLKVYRQAVLQWAFEGKLTNIGGYGNTTVRLEELCYFITKGTTPSKEQLFQEAGEIPFIKVYNLTFDGRLDFSIIPTFVSKATHEVLLSRSKVLPGDVLMNIVGPPLGKVSIVPQSFPEWNINQAIARFRCKEKLNNKFLAHYLMSDLSIENMKKKAKATAGQFNLTLEICRDIEIPLPSIPEQQQIVAEIESRLSVCDKLEETITQSLLQAEALRQSILKKAFAGKLVPQDPTDEPAEKLLARIRAERAAAEPVKKKPKGRTAK